MFGFFSNPEYMGILLRGWRGFRMLGSDGSVAVGCRTRVEVKFGFVPVVLFFEHMVYEPPLRFAEELVHGPFAKFSHVHEFMPTGSRTTMRDLVVVELPTFLGGELAVRHVVAPKIREFFCFRHRQLERLVADGTVQRVAARTA